jgi:prepilin-type N-terminal cleavage/methylation domain-containing protein
MKNIRAFTLVEILVVVAVMVMLAALTMPGIKAMQSASARSEAMNTINAALQGVRSYAIMNNCKTAARFQPNGKIAFVYRFDNNQGTARYCTLGNANPDTAYPTTGTPNTEGYIYLPVLDQEPLSLPKGYAADRLAYVDTDYESGLSPTYYEPFYICYNPDGTLAKGETICVAMVQNITTDPYPINPNFNGDATYTWEPNDPPTYTSSSGLSNWLKFIRNDSSSSNKDVTSTNDVNDRKLARFFYIAESLDKVQDIFEDNQDDGIDHYAGNTAGDDHSSSVNYPATLSTTSVSEFAIFKTPDNWNSLPLYVNDSNDTQTKSSYIADTNNNLYTDNKTSHPINTDSYETIFLNPYTGRMIRPME